MNMNSEKEALYFNFNYYDNIFETSINHCANELRVSLTCPLTMTPIKVPVRGDNCHHIAVFSLDNYLQSIEKSIIRRWECPLCKKPILKFIFDRYFYNII